jgi:hypothetical protein
MAAETLLAIPNSLIILGDDQATAMDVEGGGIPVLVEAHCGQGGGRLLDLQGFLGALSVICDLVAVAQLLF